MPPTHEQTLPHRRSRPDVQDVLRIHPQADGQFQRSGHIGHLRFSRYLLDLIARERPTHLAVAFDPPCKTFRHEAYPEYKATRSAAPEVIKESLEPLTEIVKSLGIPVLMVPGYEADDVIGSMARRWGSKDCDVFMVSPDKDLGQLISDHVFQVKPGKNGAEDEVVDREQLCARFGISDPQQVVDILAIWGDTADNVPGVRGIGEVGARKLVGKYGSVDGILQHLDELPPKQAAAMKEASEHLGMSRFLVTIKTDVDLSSCTEEDLRLNLPDGTAAAALFNKYECPSLLPLLPAVTGSMERRRHRRSSRSTILTWFPTSGYSQQRCRLQERLVSY